MLHRRNVASLLSAACFIALISTSHAQTIPVPAPAPLAIKPAIPTVADQVPLADVRLTGGPLKAAQDADEKTLLALEPDRMLFFLRQRAGLEPKAARGYDGWDGAGRNLTGHIAGHYLSAISYMFASTGDKRYKDRVDYMVHELKEIQDAQKDGYIGALMGNAPRPAATASAPATATASATAAGGRGRGGRGPQIPPVDGKILFQQIAAGQINSGGFDLNGMWSPWYVEHKLFAGLRDAYRITGNKEALDVEVKFAAWVESIMGKLTEEQLRGGVNPDTGRRVAGVLDTEFGGINETLADLYADTGDKRWYDLSSKFEHTRVITPMANKQDNIGGLHGNTTIPKLYGELKRYIYTGDELNGNAAKFFWDATVAHHTFATGGHGYDESFGPADKLSLQVDGSGQRSQDLRTCESCNIYNMLKYTRTLFTLSPEDKYAEFHERALFNHVMASIDPATGRTCYMVPIGLNVNHDYTDSFTCCIGSGYESHALHADGLYNQTKDRFWVNQYAPSTAKWGEAGIAVDMQTGFPMGDSATLAVTSSMDAGERTISFRRPAWAVEGFVIDVNGTPVRGESKPGSYIDIKRSWNKGDKVTLKMPKTLHTEPLVDNPSRMALMWGPLVLACDMGPVGVKGKDAGGRGRNAPPTPAGSVFVTAEKSLDKWLKPVDKPGTFQATTAGGQAITFTPFYQVTDRRYGIYWDVFTPDEWAKQSPEYAKTVEAQKALAAKTVGYAQPGMMQAETDHHFAGENTTPVIVADQPGRRGNGWFSMDIEVDPTKTLTLVVTYNGGETAKRTFDVSVDGTKVASETVDAGTETSKFKDVEYKLPADLVKDKKQITVKFQATGGNEMAAVFGVRVTKAE